MTLNDLGLGPLAQVAAAQLLAEFGSDVIRFTRGWSDLRGQARAMAGNVIRNKEWIRQTYTREDRPSYAIARQLQDEVYKRAECNAPSAVAAYLYEALRRIPNADKISFHTITGPDGQPAAEAFDLVPLEDGQGIVTAVGQQVCTFIRAHRLAWHLDAFLRREGGLRIWHCQFLKPSGPVEV